LAALHCAQWPPGAVDQLDAERHPVADIEFVVLKVREFRLEPTLVPSGVPLRPFKTAGNKGLAIPGAADDNHGSSKILYLQARLVS